MAYWAMEVVLCSNKMKAVPDFALLFCWLFFFLHLWIEEILTVEKVLTLFFPFFFFFLNVEAERCSLWSFKRHCQRWGEYFFTHYIKRKDSYLKNDNSCPIMKPKGKLKNLHENFNQSNPVISCVFVILHLKA